jgi:hypothetical protein
LGYARQEHRLRVPARVAGPDADCPHPQQPYYLGQFTPAELKRDDLAHQLSVQTWRRAGYEAFDCGRGYAVEDYGDRIHLSSTGGDRLALQVAGEVRRIANKLNY